MKRRKKMNLDSNTKRRIVEIVTNFVNCSQPFEVQDVISTLIEEQQWDYRYNPTESYKEVEKIIDTLIDILEYKKSDRGVDGIVYCSYNDYNRRRSLLMM